MMEDSWPALAGGLYIKGECGLAGMAASAMETVKDTARLVGTAVAGLWLGYLLLKLLWLPWRRRRFYEKQGVRGPRFVPFVGNARQFKELMDTAPAQVDLDKNGLAELVLPHINHWARLYAPGNSIKAVVFEMFSTTRIALWDPSLVKQVLASKMHLYQRDEESRGVMLKIVGDGIVLREGEFWASQRRIMSPAFRHDFVKGLFHHIVQGSELLLDELERELERNAGRPVEVEIHSPLNRMAMDIISRALFGGSGPASHINVEKASTVFRCVDEVLHLFLQEFLSLRRLIPGRRWLPKTASSRRVDMLESTVASLLEELVESRLSRSPATGAEESQQQSTQDDVMGVLLQALRNGSKTMTKEQIMNECRTLFIAGHATTSYAVSYALLLLARHPEWQERARAEVLETFGTDTVDADGMSKLRIMGMVLQESMRLYPALASLSRVVKDRHKLGNLEMLPGTFVQIPIVMMHQLPEIWGDDYLEFRPDRFEHGVSAATSQHAQAYIPFSAGPRICLGLNFGSMEAKTVIARILQRYRLAVSPSYRHCPGHVFKMEPRYGVQLIVSHLDS